ncbi:hypothetical protein BJ742DRAFT_409393 [Cladochytrium replicatum]|nr:hypothetical protein BJ742DRAFT_409393 [Cladochytrium replicatum]
MSLKDTTERLQRWKSRLANLTELILPTDYPRQIPPKIIDAELSVDISAGTADAILSLAFSLRSPTSPGTPTSATPSPFTILLAAFAVILHRYTGEEDIVVASSSQSFNPLVLRLPVASSGTFGNVLRAVLDAEASALADEIPFMTLLEGLSPENGATAAPSLSKVRFFNLTDTSSETLASTTSSSISDITIFISQTPTLRRLLPIQLRVVYNATLFSQSRIADMLDQLSLILTSAAADVSTPIGNIDIVTERAKQAIPDPRADLHWGHFEGAITDIFARNAAAFPERTCVVESVYVPESPLTFSTTRQFSYTQINQASNVLAHHLIRSGIQREDLVVLYSYRGVDLVVAVMGVLKAGATFSVIDPAYPPSRQIIYLSVAQPRGLVVLRKAGTLSDEVRQYIQTQLSVQCEVPALELLDNGSVLGGTIGESGELFKPDLSYATVEPGVVIGPDCVGTLSFTSGSTGIPKGVRGRHFSLTHFYPWMSQEFGLSSSDRFTMLSGIAHDPIQRDIFTPLFLGAQLRIPTPEDIGQPGRLAQWMGENEVTITHLTPAMGQLLSANATHPIPTLRNAFFVGDVLTKRDVTRLQHLGQNCFIINMYGTTETQRAVSYLKIPPPSVNPGFLSEQKDIMPAGRGMKNVQLIVLNKAGRLCGIGEVGELYVRSGGLAEGYLRLEDVTKEKFIQNPFAGDAVVNGSAGSDLPFYKGPRDRMYRTGDLGRYRPDGNVECTGRADDQVKIRGFRIELGEIDTHLSQHPQVRENVTLVRRDKDEEQTLVSYIVPLDPSVETSELVKSIREYLKLKLPSYAVPKVFVPLVRMPLTPNGKVDKNALPFPDTALAFSGPPAAEKASAVPDSSAVNLKSLTITEQNVITAWSKLLHLPVAQIGIDDSFFDLGGHSILATRLIFEVRKVMSVDVPLGIVYQDPTVRGMAKQIDQLRGSDLMLVAGRAVALDQTINSDSPIVTNANGEPIGERVAQHAVAGGDDGFRAAQVPEYNYAADLDVVDDVESINAKTLPALKFPDFSAGAVTVFLTGATGFLGAFIVSTLLETYPNVRLICHVRASNDEQALSRLEYNGRRHLAWDDVWVTSKRLTVVVGDLGAERLGIAPARWEDLTKEVDIIVHNGAMVHWVYPYPNMRASNVLATKECLRLATTHKLKPLHFISSTSALDTPHYMQLQDLTSSASPESVSSGEGTVLEQDNLEGSRVGLRSGYGQTKWVSEKLVMRARERGVPCTIIRPGYILGHSQTGVGNVDDFLWRLVKGCIQLGKVPQIANIVNAVPVDYVARIVAAVVGQQQAIDLGVFHVWNDQRFRFDDLFAALTEYGYSVSPVEYVQWRSALMELTLSTQDNALYPLLHFVLDDLPTSTKAPLLDDRNTRTILAAANALDGMVKISPGGGGTMGLYLGYLVAVGFLEQSPSGSAKVLPSLAEWEQVKGKIIGRSGR